MDRQRIVRASLILLPVSLVSAPILAPVAVVALIVARGVRPPPSSGLAAPAGVAFLAATVVAVTHAGAPGSFTGYVSLLGLSCLLVAWTLAARPEDGRSLVLGAATVLFVQLLVAVAQVGPGQMARAAGTTFHPNVLGAIAAICGVWLAGTPWTPIAASHPERFGRRSWKIVALATTALLLALSGSRGAILGSAVGFTVLAGAQATRGSPVRRGSAVVAVGAVVVASVVVLLLPSAQQRWSDLEGTLDLVGRPGIWGVAIEAIAERPLLGHGFDAWARIATSVEPSVRLERMSSAHNGYLETLLSGGTYLLTALGALLAAIYAALAARARSNRGRATVATAVLATFLVHNLVESLLFHGQLVALVWLPVGLALVESDATSND